MDQIHDGEVATATTTKTIGEVMNESREDRKRLHATVAARIDAVMRESLAALEEATSDNPNLFRILRKRVLDVAGYNRRQTESDINDFLVIQMYEREQVVVNRVNPDDPWRLPYGCKMPNDKTE